MLQLIIICLFVAICTAIGVSVYYSIKTKEEIRDLHIKLNTANLQVKLSKVSEETAKESWSKAYEKQTDALKFTEKEVLRKQAYIDQLTNEARQREETIKLLKAEMQKLEKYRPVQGTGGRFVKKSMQPA